MRLDGVRIETGDPEAESARYATLLGVEPCVLASGARRFQLVRGAPQDAWPAEPAGYHGLAVSVEVAPAVTESARRPDAVEAIDHVVVFTPSPTRAIALWRDRLGLRLAFDREFPERKVRLLFFRSGGLTFEFACALPAPADDDGPDR